MVFTVNFDRNWIYSDGGIHASVVSNLIREFRKEYGKENVEIKTNSMDMCAVELKRELSDRQAAEILHAMLERVMKGSDISANCRTVIEASDGIQTATGKAASGKSGDADSLTGKILAAMRSFSTAAPEEEAVPETAAAPEEPAESGMECIAPATADPTAEETVDTGSAIDRIEALVGLYSFKNVCEEISARAPKVIANKTQRFFFAEAFLAAANVGNGFSTSCELLNDLLCELGLFAEKRSIRRFSLPDAKDSDVSRKMCNIIDGIEAAMAAPGIIVLDMASWTDHTHDSNFKELLMMIFRKNRSSLIIFWTPYIKPAKLKELCDDIGDILSVRAVPFEPFDTQELRELSSRLLRSYGVSFASDALEEFDRRIQAEKRDGLFYGVHTVEKVTGELIRRLEASGSGTKIITREIAAYGGITGENKEDVNGFDDLIGMEQVEKRLHEAVNQIVFARRHQIGQSPCMHMCFTGNPGTGKTTAARILGQELKRRGLLRIGKFYECTGRDLCAEYVGQTAPKTHAVCQNAYGSVLFIDEAYSLAAGHDSDYGREALATLITEMENHYDDLVVILAGYPDDMQRLLDFNPGLRSRVPYIIDFPSYSREDLYNIFMNMVSRQFRHGDAFDERAMNYFLSLSQQTLSSKSFGNARFVRNFYERVWGKALTHNIDSEDLELTVEDLKAAIAEFSA